MSDYDLPGDFMAQVRRLEDFAKQRLAEKHALMRERADAIDADKKRTMEQLAHYGVPYHNGSNPDA